MSVAPTSASVPASRKRPGVYVLEDDRAVSPDLFLGYAGAGSLLLRLANPADAPDLVLGQLNNNRSEKERAMSEETLRSFLGSG